MSGKSKQNYISKVRLKGYKSIIDTECIFKPGLNIIIGDNGSGKSNFLSCMNSVIFEHYDSFNNTFSAEFSIIDGSPNGRYYLQEVSPQRVMRDEQRIPGRQFKETYTPPIKGKLQEDSIAFARNESFPKRSHNPFTPILYINFIKYGIPKYYESLKNHTTYSFKIIDQKDIFPEFIDKKEQHQLFIHDINSTSKIYPTNELIYETIQSIVNESKSKEDFNISEEIIFNTFNAVSKELNFNLETYTNIQGLRMSNRFALNKKDDYAYDIDFINFLFFVNNHSNHWVHLSDGTKRLFHIVSQVTALDRGLFLIEEPELGIHPTQLFKLMEFLKEQSKTKQIIISTHSPDILNHLKKDELDRIIVCKHEGKEGTKMYHLEEEEKENLRNYMVNDGYISDYWTQIGFNKEGIETL